MKADVLLGLQWGDEGKGKATDAISYKEDYGGGIRFQGGPNAGHSIEFDTVKTVLHTIPSNIFKKFSESIIANGVLIDPVIFMQEILNLVNNFPDLLTMEELLKKIIISNKAHLILPSHKILDKYQETKKGKNKVGTTLKGIGPTGADKVLRVGLRAGSINDPDFQEKAKELYYEHLSIISSKYPQMVFDVDTKALFNQWLDAIEFLKKFRITDTAIYLNEAISKGKKYLGEGAQGTFLDIDHGTYPGVTASNTSIGGFFTGTGISPKHLGKVFGLFKAYTTRVGEGPFPTELLSKNKRFLGKTEEEWGIIIQRIGAEFGATTGRPRRCGWLDLVLLKYSCMINGVTELIMTKADILDGIPKLKVCVAYENNHNFPDEKAIPIYQTIKGWQKIVDENGKFDKNFLAFINMIEKYLELPITIISTGPDRKDIIYR